MQNINTKNQAINKQFYSAYKAPITVNLTAPSVVKVLSHGRVLYRGNLSQGIHIIDTNKFPDSTYPIDIKKNNLTTGEETTVSDIFHGQSSQYNWMYSGFELMVGQQSQYFKSAEDEHKILVKI